MVCRYVLVLHDLPFPSVALARNASSMLNDESGQDSLVPNLREKGFNLSPLSVMLALTLSYIGVIMLLHFFCLIC